MNSRITFIDPSDERWMELVIGAPGASVFHHPAWMGVLAECYGYRPFVAAIVDAGGVVNAGLPMMEVSSPLTGRRWVSLPFTDHCAPLYRSAQALEALVSGLAALAEERDTPRMEMRSNVLEAIGTPMGRYVLHTLCLTSNVEQVACRLHRTHRYSVAQAVKKGVRVVLGDRREDVAAFYELHVRTRRRHGVPVQPWLYFERLGEMLEQGLGMVLRAHHDGECVAAAVLLRWQQTLIYKYAASNTAGQELCANHMIVDAAIRWGCEHGYRTLDMGRSEIESTGLREFKARWGAEETALTYSALAAQPSLSPGNGKLARALQIVIQSSPPWVCRTAGELLYRHFG